MLSNYETVPGQAVLFLTGRSEPSIWTRRTSREPEVDPEHATGGLTASPPGGDLYHQAAGGGRTVHRHPVCTKVGVCLCSDLMQ